MSSPAWDKNSWRKSHLLVKLTSGDLQQFYIRLKQGGRLLQPEKYGLGLSDRMVKCCHVTCRIALDKAAAQGLILKNPARACKAPATHPKEMKILTQEEMQRLLIQASREPDVSHGSEISFGRDGTLPRSTANA